MAARAYRVQSNRLTNPDVAGPVAAGLVWVAPFTRGNTSFLWVPVPDAFVDPERAALEAVPSVSAVPRTLVDRANTVAEVVAWIRDALAEQGRQDDAMARAIAWAATAPEV